MKHKPLFDTATKNLPNEKWKDFPEFEGLYKISNYGRVKSLSRGVYYSETKPDVFRPGRIIKLRTSISRKGKKEHIDIQVKLHKDGSRYQFSVARYVFYLFVRKFDLHDHGLVVTRKDGDKLNCYYTNLWLCSISDMALQGYQ